MFDKQLKNMKVPESVMSTINKLKTRGDVQIIANKYSMSRYDVDKVLEDNDPTPEAIANVADYYRDKMEVISDYLTND